MRLRFRNPGFAVSAIYVVLFLADVSVAAQDAGDNPRLEPAAKAKTEKNGTTALEAQPDISINATAEKKDPSETTGEAAAPTPQGSSDKWEFAADPYLWLAGIKGTVGVGTFTTNIDPGFSDILNSLKFGFMGSFQAKKNKFFLATDLMYLNVEKTQSTRGTLFSSLSANTKSFMLSPVAGYRLASKEGAGLDAFVGIRYWHMSTRLEATPALLPGRVAESSRNWVDVIGGLRGQVHLTRIISVLGRGDFGGGGSDYAYQLFGGMGLDVSRKVTLITGYRNLYIKYTKDNFLFDGSIRGLLLGATFRF